MPLQFTKSRSLQLEERLAKLRGETPGLVIRAARQFGVPSALKPAAKMNGSKISGLCVPYGALSLPMVDSSGRYQEQYAPQCFSRSLNDGDLRCCANHDRFSVLGRVGAGTCRFWEDDTGLYVEADVPDTTWARDLLVSIRRNDICSMSAGFFITKDSWGTRAGQRVRTIQSGHLIEASVVSYAQYPQTTAAVEDPDDGIDELLAASQQLELATRSAAQHRSSRNWDDPLEVYRAQLDLLRLR